MTLSASSTRQIASGNGSQTLFSFSFRVFSASDIQVYVNNSLLLTGYTVSINSDFNGGSVTISPAPSAGTNNVLIVRKESLNQDYDPQEQGGFNSSQVENAFDKTVMKIQNNAEEIGRALRIPIYLNNVSTLMPDPVASRIIRWNAAANAIELVSAATIVTEGGGGGGGGGSGVTSVGMVMPTDILSVSPGSLSSAGTFTISKVNQAQNTVFAGPTSGTGSPVFRALVAADIPNLDGSKITTGTVVKAQLPTTTVFNDQSNVYSGSFTQNFGAAGQTVVLPMKTTPGSPTTGEIWIEGTTVKYRDNSGPTTRDLISSAFQVNTTSPLTGGGAFTSNLTLGLSTVPATLGGTGISSFATGDILYASNSTTIAKLPIGTAGQFLSVASGLPTWVSSGAGVTSVDMSLPSFMQVTGNPITSSGTLAVTMAGGQTANRFLATPDGSTGAVSLRSIVAADLGFTLPISKGGTNNAGLVVTAGVIPRGDGTKLLGLALGTAGQLLRVNGTATDIEWFTSGGGTGTVTSIGLGLPAGGELVNSGTASPITTSGTYTLGWASQTTNKVFAAPDGSTGTPTFRVLAPGDIPSINASKITAGTFPEARGGTNQSTYATGDIIYASATDTLSKRAIGSTGNALVVSGGVPTWGSVGVASGGTGQTSYTAGDIIYASGATTLAKLAIGSSGQVLTVSGGLPAWSTSAGGGSTVLSAIKSADLPKTSDITLADDNHLSVAVEASSTYHMTGVLFFSCTGTTADLKMTFVGPTGVTGSWSAFDPADAVLGDAIAFSTTGVIQSTNGTKMLIITARIVVSTTAGNFKLQWAQNSSSTQTVTMKANSFMQLIKQ